MNSSIIPENRLNLFDFRFNFSFSPSTFHFSLNIELNINSYDERENGFKIGNNGYLLRNSEATGNASISSNQEIDIQVFPNIPTYSQKEI